MPPDPPSMAKNFSHHFAVILIFRHTLKTGQILGWIRPCIYLAEGTIKSTSHSAIFVISEGSICEH